MRTSLKAFIRRWLLVIAAGSMTAPAAAQTIIYYPPAGGVNGGVVNSFTADQYFSRVCFGATVPDVSLERDSAGLVKVTDCGAGPTLKSVWANSMLTGDTPGYFTAGGLIPADTLSGDYPVQVFGLNVYNKRTVTDLTNRNAGMINYLVVSPASGGSSRYQRAQYNVVEWAAAGNSTSGRSNIVNNEAYHWDNHALSTYIGTKTEMFNGVYGCSNGGGYCGGGAITDTFGVWTYIHQQTANTSAAMTNATGGYFVVDSNSGTSPITNVTGVAGYVFADAGDNAGVKNVTNAWGGDFEVANFAGGTITAAFGIYQDVESNGGGHITTAYGNYIDFIHADGTRWAYYNNDTTAPSLSKSNWRAPFHASEASTVLSVTTNAITPTNTIHHVGAGLIKTITVPAMCAPTCTIFLIPDAAFTYDATGNVVVPSGGGTATVNRAMTMVWDGTKWYPSY